MYKVNANLYLNAPQTTKNQIQRHQNKAQISTQLSWRKNDAQQRMNDIHSIDQQKHTKQRSAKLSTCLLLLFQLFPRLF